MDDIYQQDALLNAILARRNALEIARDERNQKTQAVADLMLRAVASRRTQAEIRDLALDEVTDEHRAIEAQLLATATRLFIAASKTKHRVSPTKAVHDAKDLMVQTRYYRRANNMSGSYPDV